MVNRIATKHRNSAQRNTRTLVVSALVLALTASLSACTSSLNQQGGPTATIDAQNQTLTPNGQPRSTKIALLLPLGGFNKTAVIAKNMKQAAEMALFERNESSIQLMVKDSQGTAEGARLAANEAITQGAQIILGPLLSKSVTGAAAVARPANVPIVSFSNNKTVAGQGVHLMSLLPEQEVERITSYAISRGKRRFAALIPDTVYGHTVETTFRNVVSRSGGQIIALERYPATANGMLKPAQRVFEIIKESQQLGAPIDALFLPGGQDTLPSIGPLIAYSNLQPGQIQLLGTAGWEFPNIGRDNAFVGGWYPSPDPRGWKAFSGRFAKNFGQAPPRLASLAYDAVDMAITLVRNKKNQRVTSADLARTAGFRGIDGPFRFTPNGLLLRGLAILEVQKFGSQLIDAAPGSLMRAYPASTSATTTAPTQPAATSSAPFGAFLFSPQ